MRTKWDTYMNKAQESRPTFLHQNHVFFRPTKRLEANADPIWPSIRAGAVAALTVLLLGTFFYLIVTPLGWTLRLIKYKLLSLCYAPEASSYWLVRTPPGSTPSSMSEQV
jgi:hypothetical protein